MYLRLVEDKVAVVLACILFRVVGGVVELVDGGMEVVPSLVGYVKFNGDGSFDHHCNFTDGVAYYIRSGVGLPKNVVCFPVIGVLP